MAYIFKPEKKKHRQLSKGERHQQRQKIYQSKQWQNLRLAYLKEHPLCELCEAKGKLTGAVDVHHKVSFMRFEGARRAELAYSYENLQALCKSCHAEIHNGIAGK